jgi:hypothetical protein
MAVEFDAALRGAGRRSDLVVAPGLNHIEIPRRPPADGLA